MPRPRASARPTSVWVPILAVLLLGAAVALLLGYFQQRVRQSPGFVAALDSVSRSRQVQGLVGAPVVLHSTFVQSEGRVGPEGQLVFYRFTVRGDRGECTVRVLAREVQPPKIVAVEVE